MAPRSKNRHVDHRPNPSIESPQSMIKIVIESTETSAASGLPIEPETEFNVHKAFICHYSPYIAKTLTKPEQIEIRIDDSSPKAFGIFVHWLYYQNLGSLEGDPDFYLLCEVWMLAKRFWVPKLQNMVMDSLHKVAEDNDSEGVIRVNDESGFVAHSWSDELKNFLLDMMVTTKIPSVLEQLCKYVSKDMVKDAFLARVFRELEGNATGLGPASDYYVPDLATETDTE
ncbi:hypothetical protein BKA64DRAFT_722409 [Cadophora sp. MPI-SDFR-AT-0126]|nr:hypothetical protein BKA64DRAFT_722409 [Leotiomycetes sp. MPI-SDFR-AT-0126]